MGITMRGLRFPGEFGTALASFRITGIFSQNGGLHLPFHIFGLPFWKTLVARWFYPLGGPLKPNGKVFAPWGPRSGGIHIVGSQHIQVWTYLQRWDN